MGAYQHMFFFSNIYISLFETSNEYLYRKWKLTTLCRRDSITIWQHSHFWQRVAGHLKLFRRFYCILNSENKSLNCVQNPKWSLPLYITGMISSFYNGRFFLVFIIQISLVVFQRILRCNNLVKLFW